MLLVATIGASAAIGFLSATFSTVTQSACLTFIYRFLLATAKNPRFRGFKAIGTLVERGHFDLAASTCDSAPR